MPNGTNYAGTPNGKHIWTQLELEHAIVLRQYGKLNHKQIAQVLNYYFSTTKTASTVQNTLDIEAGTLCNAEVMRRKNKCQPPVSSLWQYIEEIGSTALEVGLVLFEHRLITLEVWEEWRERHRIALEQQIGMGVVDGNGTSTTGQNEMTSGTDEL
ncbi:hypothetical protein MMC17_008034 [Xylographa soralifera]|nr:hypothetical protein [Xylographa soralifera]